MMKSSAVILFIIVMHCHAQAVINHVPVTTVVGQGPSSHCDEHQQDPSVACKAQQIAAAETKKQADIQAKEMIEESKMASAKLQAADWELQKAQADVDFHPKKSFVVAEFVKEYVQNEEQPISAARKLIYAVKDRTSKESEAIKRLDIVSQSMDKLLQESESVIKAAKAASGFGEGLLTCNDIKLCPEPTAKEIMKQSFHQLQEIRKSLKKAQSTTTQVKLGETPEGLIAKAQQSIKNADNYVLQLDIVKKMINQKVMEGKLSQARGDVIVFKISGLNKRVTATKTAAEIKLDEAKKIQEKLKSQGKKVQIKTNVGEIVKSKDIKLAIRAAKIASKNAADSSSKSQSSAVKSSNLSLKSLGTALESAGKASQLAVDAKMSEVKGGSEKITEKKLRKSIEMVKNVNDLLSSAVQAASKLSVAKSTSPITKEGVASEKVSTFVKEAEDESKRLDILLKRAAVTSSKKHTLASMSQFAQVSKSAGTIIINAVRGLNAIEKARKAGTLTTGDETKADALQSLLKKVSASSASASDSLTQGDSIRPQPISSTGKSTITRALASGAKSALVQVMAAKRLLTKAQSQTDSLQFDLALSDTITAGLDIADSLSTVANAMSEAADAVRHGKGGVALTLTSAQVRASLNDASSILAHAVNLTKKIVTSDPSFVNATLQPGVETESVKSYTSNAKKEINEAVSKSKEAIKLLKQDKVGVAEKISASIVQILSDATRDTFKALDSILAHKQSLTSGGKEKLVEVQALQQRMVQILNVVTKIASEASASQDKKIIAPGAKPETVKQETQKLVAAASKLQSSQQLPRAALTNFSKLNADSAHESEKIMIQSLKDAANALLESAKVSQRSVVAGAVAQQSKETSAVAQVANTIASHAIIQAATVLNALNKLQIADPRIQKATPGKANSESSDLHLQVLAMGRQSQLLLLKVDKHTAESRTDDASSGATETMKLAAKGLTTVADLVEQTNLDRKDGSTTAGDERKLASAISEALVLIRAAAVATDAQAALSTAPHQTDNKTSDPKIAAKPSNKPERAVKKHKAHAQPKKALQKRTRAGLKKKSTNAAVLLERA